MISEYLINGPVTRETITGLLNKIGELTDSGGHSLFLGQVRADERDGKKVKAIEYSAYNEMVKTEVDTIKQTIFSEFDEVRYVEILHSTGIVKAGEVSLLILVSAGHRHQAMKACSKSVELIKEKLPVWKKEIFEDDTHQWRQNE